MQNIYYETHELLAVRRHIYVPKTFLLNSLFARKMLSSKRQFLWEEIVGTRSIAPWAVSTSTGDPIATFSSETKSFRTGGIKMLDSMNPEDFSTKLSGLGELGDIQDWSPEKRWAAYIVDVIRQQKAAAERTLEKMAWNLVTDGTVTINGVQYPTETIDMNRDSELTRVLDTNDQWDNENSRPLQIIQDVRNKMMKSPFGGPLGVIIMGWAAYAAFQTNANIKEFRDKNYNVFRKPLDINVGLHKGVPYELQGYIDGVPLVTFNDYYEQKNADGTITLEQYLDPRDVIFLGPNAEGRQCYSPVYNFHANLRPYQYFQKMITNRLGTEQSIYAELNPLLVILGANNTARVRVVANKE